MLPFNNTLQHLDLSRNNFNDSGFEIADILTSIARLGLSEDERIKAISAEEYQKHADSLLKSTNDLMSKIATIEKDLEEAKAAEE